MAQINAYLRVRKISIDVLPDAEPFISIFVDKVILNEDGSTKQTIGNFDRLSHKASEILPMDAGNISDDGIVDGLELFTLVQQTAYTWVMMKHGGVIIDGKVAVD